MGCASGIRGGKVTSGGVVSEWVIGSDLECARGRGRKAGGGGRGRLRGCAAHCEGRRRREGDARVSEDRGVGDSGCCAVAVVVDVGFTLARSVVFEPGDCATAAAAVRQWAEAGEAWLLVLVWVWEAQSTTSGQAWTSSSTSGSTSFRPRSASTSPSILAPPSSLFPLPHVSHPLPLLSSAPSHPRSFTQHSLSPALDPFGMIGCESCRLVSCEYATEELHMPGGRWARAVLWVASRGKAR